MDRSMELLGPEYDLYWYSTTNTLLLERFD